MLSTKKTYRFNDFICKEETIASKSPFSDLDKRCLS